MRIINHNGQKVYTHSANRASKKDLAAATIDEGIILDAYFFTIDGDRLVNRVDFDRRRVESGKSGLMIDVKHSGWGQSSVAIAGLGRVTQFLYDTRAMGELSSLKGMFVTTYSNGIATTGIGVEVD